MRAYGEPQNSLRFISPNFLGERTYSKNPCPSCSPLPTLFTEICTSHYKVINNSCLLLYILIAEELFIRLCDLYGQVFLEYFR